jgi:hypothetical protein
LCFEKKKRLWVYYERAYFGRKGMPGFIIGTVVRILRVNIRGVLDLMFAE